ncbi:hypothetical protein [Tateyamaria sp.]|uniref:hypothetical protein n=1 Tax=Tateyamaria sp. TaxID=1929288 RepID=UPI003B2229CF
MSHLPPSLREIADHAGENIACAIAYLYGGALWQVPSHVDAPAAERLVDLVGRGPVITLTLALRGVRFSVPLARRAVILWLMKRGCGASEIARDLKISQRTARRYMRTARDR